ncbi:hypothetical protein ACI65C_003933, partial [Semiaphis heraclei]
MKKIAYITSKQQLYTDSLILYPFYSNEKGACSLNEPIFHEIRHKSPKDNMKKKNTPQNSYTRNYKEMGTVIKKYFVYQFVHSYDSVKI